jgi:signal peptidase I
MKHHTAQKGIALRPSRWTQFWREWVKPLLFILAVTGAMRSALADRNHVPTGSMVPTILEGDRIFVNKLAYDLKVPFTTWHLAEWASPQRGDIVVFFSPWDGTRLVKRVVGLPGDSVAMEENRLLINGHPVESQPMEASLASAGLLPATVNHRFFQEQLGAHDHAMMLLPGINSRRSFAPQQVPAGCYFMMGDSRDNSFDSRFFGCVERRRIVGRAVAVVTSLDPNQYYWPRWSRFLTGLP